MNVREAPNLVHRFGCPLRHLPATLVLIVATILHPQPGRADDQALIPPDPWKIIHVARQYGTADVGRDALGDPRIDVESDGKRYTISFYGCNLGRNCDSVLFQFRLARPGWRPARALVADWNGRKLIGRASESGHCEAVLEHPVIMRRGLPADTMHATFEAWELAMREFAYHIEY